MRYRPDIHRLSLHYVYPNESKEALCSITAQKYKTFSITSHIDRKFNIYYQYTQLPKLNVLVY